MGIGVTEMGWGRVPYLVPELLSTSAPGAENPRYATGLRKKQQSTQAEGRGHAVN